MQPKPQANKTDKNKTEWNNPDPIYSGGIREQLEDYFYQALEVDLLLRLCPDDEDTIYQIVDLLVDTDPQGSLTISMGWQQPDELPTTLSTLMQKAMNDQPIQPDEGILHHAEGVGLIPANIELAGLEVALVNSMNREKMLKQVLDSAKREYDFILLDCMPSLGMLTINALAAADAALIPVQAQYLSAKGLEQLLQTVQKVRRQINPKLKIEGILLTMTDNRTNYGKQISNLIRQAYGKHLKVFEQTIPRSVRAAETSAAGKSIFAYDAFTAKYGLLNDRRNGRLFEQDSSYYLLCSLENLDEQGQLKSKAAMFTKRTIRPERTVTSVDTPQRSVGGVHRGTW